MKKTLLFAILTLSINAFAQTPEWLWVKSINGTTSAAFAYSDAITLDQFGNIYTTGSFSGTVDFDPGVGTYNLTSSAQGSGFILKTDAVGNFVWAKRMRGSDFSGGVAITIDAQGNVYTTGNFMGTVDFDPGTGVFNLTTHSAQGDAFISKLDKDGNFVWAKSTLGLTSDAGSYVSAIALDSSGNVYTTGMFGGTVDFNPGTESLNITASKDGNMFISKLDSLGNFVWAKAFGGASLFLESNAIAIDVSSNVYTTGTCLGTGDFDPGTGVYNLTSSHASALISKLDASGNLVWVKQIGGGTGSGPVSGYAIATDLSGNIYTTGYYSYTVDFDPGTAIFNLTSVEGSPNIFVSKYTSSGNFVWAKAMGGSAGFDNGYSIAIDSFGDVFTTGVFSKTVDFDPGVGVFNITAIGGYNGYDAFISKLDNSGNFIWANSIGGATGGTQFSCVMCSSIAIDDANNAFVTGNFSTPSATFGTIKLTKTGGYDGFIAKLSDKTTGVERVVKNDDGFSVYPNPTNGKFTISSNSNISSVEIYNLPGARIYSDIKPALQTSFEIDLSGQPKGIYLVKIKNGTNYSTKKIVLQ